MSMLRIESLTKQFGGLRAIEDLSFDVREGEVHSVIGPNGAGKTTLFNLITGVYQPTSGRVLLDGQDLSGKAVHQRSALGMSRTFQNLQLCLNMTARENVMLGGHLGLPGSLFSSLLRLPHLTRADRRCRARAAELMDYVGLGDYVDRDTTAMPYGALKRLEIARALAANPKLLLLDEPAAGLNANETAAIEHLIRGLCQEGVTVILVEHDMKLVMNISAHIVALNYGQKLAEGTAQEIRNHPEVIAAYLGAAA
ncbi:ABC transporter ATP-binding protein [Aquisalimonas lutea]|uniref:ABC transporter ATP-binding protein n=1 Tax=Aquisalimonas lutea TaxID=1327750 RepID=UPI0025B35BF0|nr:ABC transporter ATP-binding protein [Aquisalimonas lutea]MDN3518105.1 ABC transporter ATP-binding protein [Aquisalimonas lutea]